jgi:hypothetical protein
MRRISPSMAVAVLALFIALGGSTFAATHYRITSTKQIKPSVIRYLKGQKGKAGERGLTGPAGLAGATKIQRIEGFPGIVPAFASIPSYGSSVAQCPAGTTLTGGGGFVGAGGPSGGRAAVLRGSYPDMDKSQWIASAVNPGPDQYGVYPSGTAVVWAYALCASP